MMQLILICLFFMQAGHVEKHVVPYPPGPHHEQCPCDPEDPQCPCEIDEHGGYHRVD